MPRVNRVMKARKPQGSCGCGTKVKKGDPYKWIKPRYGAKRVKCDSCRFRPSELTSSKMGTVYDAQEDVEDTIAGCESVEDLQGALEDFAGTVREVGDEYQESADAINETAEGSPVAEECEEKAEGLSGWADELEGVDFDEYEEADDDGERECPKCGGSMTQQQEDDKPIPKWDCDDEHEKKCKHIHDETSKDDDDDARHAWIEDQRSRASDAAQECPV